MRIESILIKGFRCFSAEGQLVRLNDLTCLVGPNASGKTTTMAALARMFGETQAERAMRNTDFHLAPGEKLGAQQQRHIMLEGKLVFPELDGEAPAGDAIPEAFNQMVVDAPQATPYCRVRLDATWIDDGTPVPTRNSIRIGNGPDSVPSASPAGGSRNLESPVRQSLGRLRSAAIHHGRRRGVAITCRRCRA